MGISIDDVYKPANVLGSEIKKVQHFPLRWSVPVALERSELLFCMNQRERLRVPRLGDYAVYLERNLLALTATQSEIGEGRAEKG